MAIISFSISENLRKFLRRLVSGGKYKNKSSIMRDALTRMMNSYSSIDNMELNTTSTNIETEKNQIIGNVLIIIEKYDSNIEKKIARLEGKYNTAIKGKTCFNYKKNKTIVYILEDFIDNFRLFIAEMNQIQDLKNIRYVLL
ncbi:MAG: hypothetical protein GF364_01355 [Candidatus Lokiarchaeota archaeon]|nr:hypothetical protein [Candidatus Lokiarchaeota archaeon]